MLISIQLIQSYKALRVQERRIWLKLSKFNDEIESGSPPLTIQQISWNRHQRNTLRPLLLQQQVQPGQGQA